MGFVMFSVRVRVGLVVGWVVLVGFGRRKLRFDFIILRGVSFCMLIG